MERLMPDKRTAEKACNDKRAGKVPTTLAGEFVRDEIDKVRHGEHAASRDRMVDVQIARRGVRDPYVLKALRRVPREAFVEAGYEEFAYEDNPLPIGEGQTISQPYIVALMIEAAELKPGY